MLQMNGIFGKVTTHPSYSLNVSLASGGYVMQPVITKLTHVFFGAFLRSIERETLVFRLWEIFDLPGLKPPERWEHAVLDWADALPTVEGDERGVEFSKSGELKVFRAATSSTSTEMLLMILWSIPLVMITITMMVNYVVVVFLRRPLKPMLLPRFKLAMAGVMGVQLAATTGIFFATAVQVPVTFASQFVMFLVMGIGVSE